MSVVRFSVAAPVFTALVLTDWSLRLLCALIPKGPMISEIKPFKLQPLEKGDNREV